jgi:hypothetical protein
LFRWKEKDVNTVVLDGAVAFWGTAAEKDSTGTNTRTSKETRKNIMKAILKDGSKENYRRSWKKMR